MSIEPHILIKVSKTTSIDHSIKDPMSGTDQILGQTDIAPDEEHVWSDARTQWVAAPSRRAGDTRPYVGYVMHTRCPHTYCRDVETETMCTIQLKCPVVNCPAWAIITY